MKTRNIETGDMLYLKTPEEMRASKYFESEKDGGAILFSDGTSAYDPKIDGAHAGSMVGAVGVEYDDVLYAGVAPTLLSRHAFKKGRAPFKKGRAPFKKGRAPFNGHVYSDALDRMLHEIMESNAPSAEKRQTLERMASFIDELL